MAEEESLDKFLIATQSFLESKYILIDRNISILLHAAVDSEIVYNVIAQCMVNFDFISEWKKSTDGNFIKFPEDNTKKIAFIFCMLNNIDDRKLDITKVLDHYFSYNSEIKPYDLFCSIVIAEFKNLILNYLNPNNVDETVESEEQKQQEAELNAKTDEQLGEMLNLIYKLKDGVRNSKKIKKCPMSKSDVIATISTLEFAIKKRDLEYFYALVLSIKTIFKFDKKFREIVLKIETISNILIRS